MNRPQGVIEIQCGNSPAQIHAGGVIGIQGPHIAPVRVPFRFSRDPIVAKIVGVDLLLPNKGRKDIAPKVVPLLLVVCIFFYRGRSAIR